MSTFWLVLRCAAYLVGIASAYHAVMNSRTSQGAVAWAISLCTFPMLAVPLYWVFGRTRFNGYVDLRRTRALESRDLLKQLMQRLPDSIPVPDQQDVGRAVLERLAETQFTRLNSTELLTDGHAAFASLFQAIDAAQRYVLIQFYIVRDDAIGRELERHLSAAVRRGVEVLMLYDEIGCHKLPSAYLRRMRDAGVKLSGFRTTQGRNNRFQINFRNHRKITIVDGTIGFLGGFNVGDEYLGRSPRFGPWRDTHVRFEGPAVIPLQISFVSDWYWAKRELPQVNWAPAAAPAGDEHLLIVTSGPDDIVETWKLLLIQSINEARQRFWLVSPYFVPDSDVLSALTLAALRGVDVRIMLPEKPDHKLVYLASFSCLSLLDLPGIRVYRYTPGFLHQKVFLMDDTRASVGTANVDHRSFRLNFEVALVGCSPGFVTATERMLESDFTHCRPARVADYTSRSLGFRFLVQCSRLFSPIL